MSDIYESLDTALYSTLAGGTALTTLLGGTAVYYGKAPDDANLPYVIWSYQGGGDENMTANRTKNVLIYVRAYAETAKAAKQLDAAIDGLLHLQTVTVSGWTNIWTARETDIQQPETDPAGVTTWAAGAFYRVRLDQN